MKRSIARTYVEKILFGIMLCISAVAYANDLERHRVIVSTDIGGTDPDDFQSMVHLLLYADTLDIEGLVSSPFGPGLKKDILKVIDKYEQDYPALKKHSDLYPSPDSLRSITKQGEKKEAPYIGYRQATEGSNWIVGRARADDPRPLHVLIWGGIEDLAQALHDAPDILPKLRVYYIGGPNKKWGPNAYQYIADNFPKLWIIESNATYRGWFVGGDQSGDWGNTSFVTKHIAGRGALGEFFTTQLSGTIKMGDTPSVAWLLDGKPSAPDQAGWGGKYVRAWKRPYKKFNRLTSKEDSIEEFGVFELVLPITKDAVSDAWAKMEVGNQNLEGFIDSQKQIHFRFSPKGLMRASYTIRSNVPSLNGLSGEITATATPPELASMPDASKPNWWVDDPAPEFAEGPHIGAKTVNRWRKAFLEDFAERMLRCSQ